MSLTIIIDDQEVPVEEGVSLMQAAYEAGVYIPSICFHPDLVPHSKTKSHDQVFQGGQLTNGISDIQDDGCGLCVVLIEGITEPVKSCSTQASPGMKVTTTSTEIEGIRKDKLSEILANHPHACLTCAQKEGCAREPCSSNVPVEERCCPKLGNCELEKVADFIGIKEDTPKYSFEHLPIDSDEPLYRRDYNLCISCTRCVRACDDFRGIRALGFTINTNDSLKTVGFLKPTPLESLCRFCGACVEVCPTGSLTDKDIRVTGTEREKNLVPCRSACSTGIDAATYVSLIAEGQPEKALAIIREKVPFPHVLGHICARPCEEVCRRGKVDDPVSICYLKRFAAEQDDQSWITKGINNLITGKTVAIIGSGPTGLTAAYYLAKKGHQTTIFEQMGNLGGMLGFGVPEFRLPFDILEKDLRYINDHPRVNIKTDKRIESLNDLKNDGYDAILVAAGSQLSRKLGIEGEDLNGVLGGLDFLREVRLGKEVTIESEVLVIGGGGVAMDVAMTTLRMGAQKVEVACLESREEMPAHEWEIQDAIEEGIKLHCSWGPSHIIEEDGNVMGCEFIRCTSVFDDEGRFNPSFRQEEKIKLKAKTIIVAIGQSPDLSFVPPNLQGRVIKTDKSFMTDISGVFAGGEITSGPGSVISAIQSGRIVASNIDTFLGGNGKIGENLTNTITSEHHIGQDPDFLKRERVLMPKLPVKLRTNNFSGIHLGFAKENATEEAKRCLRCHLRLDFRQPLSPPEKWQLLTPEILNTVPESDGVFQLLNEQKEVILIQGTPNLRQDLEAQMSNPEAKFFLFEEEMMYTKRESELIQIYLQTYGRLPSGNDELDDLF